MVMKVVISGHENGHEMSDNLTAKICAYFYPTLSNLIQAYPSLSNLIQAYPSLSMFIHALKSQVYR